MRIVVDSSSLVSLAWSGQLGLLAQVPLSPVLVASVHDETVVAGQAHGHVDATAIAEATRGAEWLEDPLGVTVDQRVVEAASAIGAVLTNDQALGRRAVNRGARWLRTADLALLAHAAGTLSVERCRGAVVALHAAGRITDALRDAYLEELP